jgi:3-deoxy-7-phosphoheptulonate synthase
MSSPASVPAPNDSSAEWSPERWRQRPNARPVDYDDAAALARAVEELRALPPLTTSWEVERLRGQLAEAAEGRRFLLQGGDCAESFDDCRPGTITSKLKIILQMSLVLSQGLRMPVARVLRLAGQYAKPRSNPMETVETPQGPVQMPSYYGDLVNSAAPDPELRRPNPARMVEGYARSAMTLNFVRALASGGFADLHHPEYWDLGFLDRGRLPESIREAYSQITRRIGDAIEFFEAVGERAFDDLARVEFFTSHEGLNLHYEAALTRRVPRREGWYCLSCHLPWIGERTRELDGAHVDFFRGIRNPIAVKVGPKAPAEEVLELTRALNPENEPGRLALIGRYGAKGVDAALPRHIAAIRRAGLRVLWICDPMHGNTESLPGGRKTRRFDAILAELRQHIDIHRAEGSHLGGVHFELTGENVQECLGGASGVTEADLDAGYSSLCDPRLNYEQAMEMAFAISEHAGARRRG